MLLIEVRSAIVAGLVVRVRRVAACTQVAPIGVRVRESVRNQEVNAMGGTFGDGDLQGVVTAVAHALVEPLLQHVGVWPPRLNIARSGLGNVHYGPPVLMPAIRTDIVRIESDIGR